MSANKMAQGSMSWFDKYGGFAQVNRVVMAIYDALLDSDEVGPYFDQVDMPRLIDHQTKFVSMLLGGPIDFTEERIGRAHASLGITDDHFDEVKRIFAQILKDNGFESDDTDLVMNEIEARRAVIVTT